MRSRTLAPGFFKNPELGRCEPHARLMFEGLWLLADRAGRLEDRPEKIRAEVFPFEPALDADRLLWQLHEHGLVFRYIASTGQELIECPSFGKFQRPYTHEPASRWPSGNDAESTPRVSQSENPMSIGVGELRLSPVSCFLSPVSLPPGGGKKTQLTLDGIPAPLQTAALKEKTENGNSALGLPHRVAACCPHDEIHRLWCELLPMLPAPGLPWRATPQRYLRARWREQAIHAQWDSVAEGLAWFKALFRYVGRSRFLTGRTGPRRAHETTFECTLEWLVKHEHWVKVQQGQYHEKGAQR